MHVVNYESRVQCQINMSSLKQAAVNSVQMTLNEAKKSLSLNEAPAHKFTRSLTLINPS